MYQLAIAWDAGALLEPVHPCDLNWIQFEQISITSHQYWFMIGHIFV